MFFENLIDSIFKKNNEALKNFLSTLIVKDNNVIFEKYFYNATPETQYDVKSITKSVTSTIIGIAMANNHLKSMDTPIIEYFPCIFEEGMDPRIKKITIGHLLSQTDGFQIWSYSMRVAKTIFGSKNWVEAILHSPIKNLPGEAFFYNNASHHLLSAAMKNSTGKTILDYANEYLFKPLGFDLERKWTTDPQGNQWGASNLHMTTRELATFGTLFLEKGYLNNRAIIPTQWVLESTRKHAQGNKKIVNGTQYGFDYGYGYGWWIIDKGKYCHENIFFSSGINGSAVFVAPKQNIVAVFVGKTDSINLYLPHDIFISSIYPVFLKT